MTDFSASLARLLAPHLRQRSREDTPGLWRAADHPSRKHDLRPPPAPPVQLPIVHAAVGALRRRDRRKQMIRSAREDRDARRFLARRT